MAWKQNRNKDNYTLLIANENDVINVYDWHGQRVNGGTDAAVMFQWAIDTLTRGQKLFVKTPEVGLDYEFNATLTYNDIPILIEGEHAWAEEDGVQGTRLIYTPTSGAFITAASAATNPHGVSMRNFMIEAETYDRETCCLDIGTTGRGSFENLLIYHFGTGISNDGSNLWGNGAGGVPNGDAIALADASSKNYFRHIKINHCYNGFRHVGRDEGNHKIYDLRIIPEDTEVPANIAILLDGTLEEDYYCADNGLNHFYGVSIWGRFANGIRITANNCWNEFYGLNIEVGAGDNAINVTDAVLYQGNIFSGQISQGTTTLGSSTLLRMGIDATLSDFIFVHNPPTKIGECRSWVMVCDWQDANAAESNLGDAYKTVRCPNGVATRIYFNFDVPDNFVSLEGANDDLYILGFSYAAGNLAHEATIFACGCDEVHDTHGCSYAITTDAVPATAFWKNCIRLDDADLSAVTEGDTIGVGWRRRADNAADTTEDNFDVLGLLFVYTGEE